MSLLQFREKIDTDCKNVKKPILDIGALKIDAAKKDSLKNTLQCSNMNSCDYIKKYRSDIYFIEISDLIWELRDLKKEGFSDNKALKEIKRGIQLKLSQTYIIFDKLVRIYNIKTSKIDQKKVLIAACSENRSDIIILSYIETTLSDVFTPSSTYDSIQLIPYNEIEILFK